MILKNADLFDYQKGKNQINWCRVNASKNQSINSAFPIINSILTAQRVSSTDMYADASTITIGSTPFNFLRTCYQPINQDSSIAEMNLIDFSNQSIDQITTVLNLFNIYLPFSMNQCDKIMDHKLITQKIPAKSMYSNGIQRYVGKIQIIALFEDLLKPQKEFPLDQISNLLSEIYSNINKSDMTKQIGDVTNYDLSEIYIISNDNMLGIDQSSNLLNYQIDFSTFISDFTNLFIDRTISVSYDTTYRDFTETGTDIISQIQVAQHNNSINISSVFDMNYVLFRDNILGDSSSSIQSYVVPIWYQNIMPDMVPSFFRVRSDGENEWVPKNICIPYGNYIRDILRFYYEFDDNLVRLIMLLIMNWLIRNQVEDTLTGEVAQLMEMITGVSQTDQYIQSQSIKNIEYQISQYLIDLTGCSTPVIYNNGKIDITTDIMMSYIWTLDDIYTMIDQINTIKFVYIMDMGYDGDLGMIPSSVLVSRNLDYGSSGLLSVFTATNMIQF